MLDGNKFGLKNIIAAALFKRVELRWDRQFVQEEVLLWPELMATGMKGLSGHNAWWGLQQLTY